MQRASLAGSTPIRRAEITSLATYVPPRVLTNADLEKLVETTDDWIVQRTGIRERHIVDPGVATSDLAVEAAREAVRRAGLTPDDIDLIIVGTVTPDMMFPSTACLVQDKLGAKRAWGFDLSAACCGFLYSLSIGVQFVVTGEHERVLVIGADVMSSIINYKDRATCVIFGDGAGAVLVEPAAEGDEGFLGFQHQVDGSGGQFLYMPAGGSRKPASHETVDRDLHTVHQDGKQVFKYAVRRTFEMTSGILSEHGFTPDDVALFVAHQANVRILEATAKKLGLPREKLVVTVDRHGNTSAASVPLALDEFVRSGKIRAGHRILLQGVGGGFTWGASLVTL